MLILLVEMVSHILLKYHILILQILFINSREKGELNMTVKEKLNLLEELLFLDKDTLEEAAELDDFEEWNSMAAISIIAMFDCVFGKELKPEEVKKFETVKDIIDKME
jgi:acyl carrier protein